MSNALHILPGFTIYTGEVPEAKVPALAWVDDDLTAEGKHTISRLGFFSSDMAKDLFDFRLKEAVEALKRG